MLETFSFDEFQERLRPFRGEIKGMLTRGRVISGIGNAYSDEILFPAGIYHLRKRNSLTTKEVKCIYEKSQEVANDAVSLLKERVEDSIQINVRDVLKVHNNWEKRAQTVGTPSLRSSRTRGSRDTAGDASPACS